MGKIGSKFRDEVDYIELHLGSHDYSAAKIGTIAGYSNVMQCLVMSPEEDLESLKELFNDPAWKVETLTMSDYDRHPSHADVVRGLTVRLRRIARA